MYQFTIWAINYPEYFFSLIPSAFEYYLVGGRGWSVRYGGYTKENSQWPDETAGCNVETRRIGEMHRLAYIFVNTTLWGKWRRKWYVMTAWRWRWQIASSGSCRYGSIDTVCQQQGIVNSAECPDDEADQSFPQLVGRAYDTVWAQISFTLNKWRAVNGLLWKFVLTSSMLQCCRGNPSQTTSPKPLWRCWTDERQKWQCCLRGYFLTVYGFLFKGSFI